MNINLINIIGAIASAIGAILSGYFFIKNRKIRNSFILRVRIPELLNTLEIQARDLSLIIDRINPNESNFDEYSHNAKKLIQECKATLYNLRNKISQEDTKSELLNLLQTIETKQVVRFEGVMEIREKLGSLINSLKQSIRDTVVHS